MFNCCNLFKLIAFIKTLNLICLFAQSNNNNSHCHMNDQRDIQAKLKSRQVDTVCFITDEIFFMNSFYYHVFSSFIFRTRLAMVTCAVIVSTCVSNYEFLVV